MIICKDTHHRIQGSESYLTPIYNHFCDIFIFWQKEWGHAKCKYIQCSRTRGNIDPYNNSSWQGFTGMARAGGLTGSYFLNVHLTDWGSFYLTSFWKAFLMTTDIDLSSVEKKVRRLTRRTERDSSDNKVSRALSDFVWEVHGHTRMYTRGQTDWYNYRYQLHSL